MQTTLNLEGEACLLEESGLPNGKISRFAVDTDNERRFSTKIATVEFLTGAQNLDGAARRRIAKRLEEAVQDELRRACT